MSIDYPNPMGRSKMFVTLLFLLFLTTTINTHASIIQSVSTPGISTATSNNGMLDQSSTPAPLMGETAPIPVPPVMCVIKRDGRREAVSFDKITKRIANLCKEFRLNELFVDPVVVAQDVVRGLFSGVTTSELDNLAAETAAYMSTIHPDYAKLASKIAISNLQKDTSSSFTEAIEMLYRYVDPKSNLPASFVSDPLYERIQRLAHRINEKIVHTRDYDFDYFGFKTMEKSYLLKIGTKVIERPQYMFMRVSLGIHLEEMDDDVFLQAAFETYDLMSEKWFIHASPTLFHAGTRTPQMSSCFLLGMRSDSIEGIYDTLSQCALISKAAGGIGLSVSNIRAKGSYIKGTKGTSNGLVPMLRVFDTTARYVDQGGGKRPGAFAIYLEPWHADIFEFLELRKNTGKEEIRARDLFYGLWIPDLFMRRVEEDGDWSLLCPAECPGLADCWGVQFEELYESYEKKGKARTTIKARELWYAILDAQMETGNPYMLYKDACNSKSNQQHLGTIKCSNLCTEIVEYTSVDEVAVCNLASIVLPKFVSKRTSLSPADTSTTTGTTAALGSQSDNDRQTPSSSSSSALPLHCGVYHITDELETETAIRPQPQQSPSSPQQPQSHLQGGYVFDHHRLYEVTKVITRNLNKIIDANYYPIQEASNSNFRHRPIGIGVQGLADAFQKMRLPFDSPEARRLNKDIFETMYYAALDASCELAEKHGPYPSYAGSPVSKGILQPDMWGLEPSDRWDWRALRSRIAQHGLRNSLLLAPMPTASTAQILGNNECFEPYTSNMYVRRVRAGEFIVVNPHLLDDLVALGLWTADVKNHLMANGGSVQDIPTIPSELKNIYKTVWEISPKCLIDLAADRGAFIDQSQSLNAFLSDANYDKLTAMHFYGWKQGLKTGMYYLRTKAATQAIQFTVDKGSGLGTAPGPVLGSQSHNANRRGMIKKTGSPTKNDHNNEDPPSKPPGNNHNNNTKNLPQVYGESCTSCSG